jgi:hypothetical protein
MREVDSSNQYGFQQVMATHAAPLYDTSPCVSCSRTGGPYATQVSYACDHGFITVHSVWARLPVVCTFDQCLNTTRRSAPPIRPLGEYSCRLVANIMCVSAALLTDNRVIMLQFDECTHAHVLYDLCACVLVDCVYPVHACARVKQSHIFGVQLRIVVVAGSYVCVCVQRV